MTLPTTAAKWQVTDLVAVERMRQDEKWGVQDHSPARWMPILMEEVGELAQEVNRLTFEDLDPIARAEAEENLRTEAVQVAAVAVAIVECALRNGWASGDS